VTTTEADPLRAPPPLFDLEDAERIAAEAYGLSGELRPLPSERDVNARVDTPDGRSYVLKLQHPADDAGVADFQTRAILHVERVDPALPVVRLIPTLEGSNWTSAQGADGRVSLVRLFTFLPGHNPRTEELDADALHAWGVVVARLARALRGFFHRAAGYPIQWDVARAPHLRPLLPSLRDPERRASVERVLDRFDANAAPVLPTLRSQVLHDDMSLDNVLVDDRGRITGIVDFGDMTHTALVCDLAATLADVLDGRPDALEMAGPMIEGYQSATPLEDEEAALLGDLVAARAATAVVIQAWRVELYPERAQYISTFDVGAWKLLQLFDQTGPDRVAAHFQALCRRRGLPYRSIPTPDLLARRRRTMGESPLSYQHPVHLERGEGVWLIDAEGRRFLDAYNNVPVVGHSHPRVVEAVAQQTRLLNTNTRYLHEAAVELAEGLLASMPPEAGFDRVLFVNSGSEANDVAWRIARGATGRRGAIITEHAYHGITEATMDFSPEEWPAAYAPPHVARVSPPDGSPGPHRTGHGDGRTTSSVDEVRRAAVDLADRGTPLAAMIVDSGFTSDGIFVPTPEYLLGAVAAVHEAGGLMIADEVQAGFGRSGGHLWSFAAQGVIPDLVTLGKPMGNGFPVAAVVGPSRIVDDFARVTGFFSTFGGNPVACAAALAVLHVIHDEGLVENARTVGGHLLGALTEVAGRVPVVAEVRGMGLLLGVDLRREGAPLPAGAVVNELRERGVLVGSTGRHDSVVKIRPPLVLATEHADLIAREVGLALESAAGR
jgi:4-aminobutyrate aminotransferase-like enzyme/Ser/Thr protein kinase RdoA (MazF antagonist)